MKQLTLSPDSLTLSVEEAARLLGVAASTLYLAIQRGEIPHVRVGRRIVIARAALDALLAAPAAAPDP